MSNGLRKLDAAVYRFERSLIVAALLVMVVVVFLDVVHRTFADPDSELAAWIVKAIIFLGGSITANSPAGLSIHAGAPYFLAVAFVGLAFFGFRSAKRERPLPLARAFAYACGLVVGSWISLQAMVWVFPNGFVWSQPLALILLLWVGFVGASMCTYEGKHLRVEAVQRYLPKRFAPPLGLVSGIVTASFLLFLAYASADYVYFHFEEWVQTEHKGGMFQGVAIPRWVGFSILPLSFLTMAARYFGAAFRAWRNKPVTGDEPTAEAAE